MNETGEELIRARIRNLWEFTDFSSTLFESLVGYAVIAADFDGNILAFNEGARQIYGYDPRQLVGKENIEVLFPPGFMEAGYLQQVVDVLLATGRFSYEGEKLRKGGERFPAQVLFTLTKDKTGKVVGFVEIVQDLTARKRDEQELQKHRDHLEVLVQERTVELAAANKALQAEITQRERVEAELRRQARELAEADRRKDEFLAMLGHELRNPLAPIRNALHILRHPEVDVARMEWARALVERQIGHMTRLVDDLLDVSRISRAKILLRKQKLDLTGLVRVSIEDHRQALEEGAGLKLEVQLAEAPVWVQGDPTRLAQVMDNLLHNAAKFTDAGGRVWLGVAVDAEHQRAVVTVRDSGVGIEAALLLYLFEPFAQGDRSLDRSRGGLGLGLALVKGLVELHGGEVQVASEGSGRGTEFTFWLPLDREAAPVATEVAPPQEPGKGPFRVVVIEDNRDTAETLRLMLELSGHAVAVAYTGPGGLETAREFRPEVVLCDIGLPGMDGYAVCRELRRHPATASVCLIAVSGYGQEEDRRRAREAGFDLHLTKPVDPVDLERVLATLPLAKPEPCQDTQPPGSGT
jgi:PAS domain S-box-containing protein